MKKFIKILIPVVLLALLLFTPLGDLLTGGSGSNLDRSFNVEKLCEEILNLSCNLFHVLESSFAL